MLQNRLNSQNGVSGKLLWLDSLRLTENQCRLSRQNVSAVGPRVLN
jgi:hypothetical protein